MQSSQSSFVDGQRLRRLADSLHATIALHGYQRVDTPIIQPADLFLTKAGDQLVSRLFTFERHNQALALRPEFTATAAHEYVRQQQTGIARWQFSGAIFEDEPHYHGREYQHFSVGAELIGMGGALAEAEIMGVALEGLMAQGVTNARLVVGHVGLMRLLVSRFGLEPRTQRFLLSQLAALKSPDQGRAAVMARMDKLVLGREVEGDIVGSGDGLDLHTEANTQQILGTLLASTQRNVTMGGRTQQDIARRLLQKRQRAVEYQQIVDAVEFLERWGQIDAPPNEAFGMVRGLIDPADGEALAMLAAWEQAAALVQAYGVSAGSIRIQPDLARSWDYYTGVVFEVYSHDGLHLAGGGRYDELISLVGGEHAVPSVGFVYYPEQILAAAASPALPLAAPLALTVERGAEAHGIGWARLLRERGVTVTLLLAEDGVVDAPGGASVTHDNAFRLYETPYSTDQIDLVVEALKRA